MVTTLMRHEIRRTWRLLGVVAGVPALLVLLAALVVTLRLPAISDLALVAGSMGILVVGVLVQVALVGDYWRSSHSAAGHLTHAIPVDGRTIYAVKLAWAVLAMLATLLVCALLFLTLLAADRVASDLPVGSLAQDLRLWWQATVATTPAWILLALAFFLLVGVVLNLAQFHFAVSVGSESWINRLGAAGPIVVYLVAVLVLQVATVIGVFAVPYGLGTGQDGTLALIPLSPSALIAGSTLMPVGFIPVLALATLVLVWRTFASWNSRISLR